MTPSKSLITGWCLGLSGDSSDLDDWVYSLNEPFDPVAIKEDDGTFLLMSKEVAASLSAVEAGERGQALIARLNGALALTLGTGPVSLNSVIHIDEEGRRQAHAFGEMQAVTIRAKFRATATVLGPDGVPKPSPPREPSEAQKLNEASETNDKIADLLVQLGRARDWYDVYKAIELAEDLCGGEHRLAKLLGPSREACKNMRSTANFYRHARAWRPQALTSLRDAKPLLNLMVRTALEHCGSRLM